LESFAGNTGLNRVATLITGSSSNIDGMLQGKQFLREQYPKVWRNFNETKILRFNLPPGDPLSLRTAGLAMQHPEVAEQLAGMPYAQALLMIVAGSNARRLMIESVGRRSSILELAASPPTVLGADELFPPEFRDLG